MEKNYTGQVLWLALLVLLLLTGLSLLPGGMTLGDFEFRKMDIFVCPILQYFAFYSLKKVIFWF